MGRYWSTRRAGSNGPAVAAPEAVPLVISNVVLSENAGIGTSLRVTWDSSKDAGSFLVVVKVFATGDEIDSATVGGNVREWLAGASCPAPGVALQASVEGFTDDDEDVVDTSAPYECLGD